MNPGFIISGFEFEYPIVLLLLLGVPPLFWWMGRQGPLPSIPVPTLRGMESLARIPKSRPGRVSWIWWLLPLTLLVLALARPRVPRGEVPDPSKGIDIMLALDFSRSMAETDFRLKGRRVSRRDALVAVTEDFIRGRGNDRIGIVCFARTPWLVSPLTLDHEWALASLKESELATGTGIGWAIQAATTFLKQDSDRSRVIIMVTDGDNSAGPRPLDTAPFAVKSGIKVYTILVGPDSVSPSAAAGHELNRVARMTGGLFFQAQDARALRDIYTAIDQLEKRQIVQKRYVNWQELYPWFTATALGIWLLGMARTRIWNLRVT